MSWLKPRPTKIFEPRNDRPMLFARPRERLLRGRLFAEPAHALLELLAQGAGALGLKATRYQSGWHGPAEPRKRGGVAIGMPRDVLADRGIGMVREPARVLAVTLGCSLIKRSR